MRDCNEVNLTRKMGMMTVYESITIFFGLSEQTVSPTEKPSGKSPKKLGKQLIGNPSKSNLDEKR